MWHVHFISMPTSTCIFENFQGRSVGRKKKFFRIKRFGNDKMNCQCKCWSVRLIVIPHNRSTCNAAVWIWSSNSKIKGKYKDKEHESVYFMENTAKNRFLSKSQKNFGVEGFWHGSVELHETWIFFSWPYFSESRPKMTHLLLFRFLKDALVIEILDKMCQESLIFSS